MLSYLVVEHTAAPVSPSGHSSHINDMLAQQLRVGIDPTRYRVGRDAFLAKVFRYAGC